MPPTQRTRADRGAVTAELAMALPLLVGVTVGLVWLLSVGLAQIRVVDAARETARALARGEAPATARALGARVAPGATTITLTHDGERVIVVARGVVAGPGGWLSGLPGAQVRAEAVALAEEPS